MNALFVTLASVALSGAAPSRASLVSANAGPDAATPPTAGEFANREKRALAAAADGDPSGMQALADYYSKRELWVEALAALERIDDLSPRQQLLAAECEYRLRRYRRVVARLESLPQKSALQAMALAKLGAFARAREGFLAAPPISGASTLRDDYWRARAEAMIETGDVDAAKAALASASVSPETEARQLFLLAKIDRARNDESRAAARLRRAADGADEWAMRARLALAAKDRAAIEALSLQWQGGAFERELQLAAGQVDLAASRFEKALTELRIVADRYPESDAALAARQAIGAALPRLLSADSALAPKTAARLFFENVEFAPPGRDGDALIARAAATLEALGLYRQTAQLLDHQVFKRLRGADRAAVAVELARAHLLASNPDAALRAIRATRIAGLPEAVNQRRRRLEAEALAKKGDAAAATELLSSSSTADDLLLRAEINWSQRAWARSASDYAAYLSTRMALKSARDREAAVRCATAFLLAGDRAGYRAFAGEAALRLEGSPEADLIRTLGEIDREIFLSRFMVVYRSVYGGA